MERVRMDLLKRNNVKVYGNGEQAIVCAHGFGCEQSMWQYITPAFAEQYKVIVFDYVGAGGSDLTAYNAEKYNSLDGYKQDLVEVIEYLNLKDVIVFGHSISSMIGMLAAIEKPELFSKLIMIGPSPCYLNMEDGFKGGFERSDVEELLEMMEMNFTGWASYMAPVGMGADAPAHLKADLENVFVSTNPKIAREFAEVTFFSDYRNRLGELTTPTLILQCAEDSIVPAHIGEYLHEHIPNNELAHMEAKGHYPHISHPRETVELIKGFLNGHE